MKTLNEFLSESVNVGSPKDSDHETWNKSGHKEFAKDVHEGGSTTLEHDTEVSGHAHHHSFKGAVPVHKYFSRHDRGYAGSTRVDTTLKKGTKIVVDREHGYAYGHCEKHGFIRFNHDGDY